jgi:hypothetical protein
MTNGPTLAVLLQRVVVKKMTFGDVAVSLVGCGTFALLTACGGGSAFQEAAGTITAAKPTADQTATNAATSPAEAAVATAAEGSAAGNASSAKATTEVGGHGKK